MSRLLSGEALARLLGVSGQAVRKARAAGRLSSIDGKFDPAVARIQWEANRKRRRPALRHDAPAAAAARAADLADRLGTLSDTLALLGVRLLALRLHLDELGESLASLLSVEVEARARTPSAAAASGPAGTESGL